MGMEGLEPPTLWFVAIDSDPLSYIPEGRMTGFEPAHDGATNHYLNHLVTPAFTKLYLFFLHGSNVYA